LSPSWLGSRLPWFTVRIVTPHDFGVSRLLVVYAIVAGFMNWAFSGSVDEKRDPAVAGPVVTALSMISSSILAIAMVVAARVATLLGTAGGSRHPGALAKLYFPELHHWWCRPQSPYA
jgi:hypothetical protein